MIKLEQNVCCLFYKKRELMRWIAFALKLRCFFFESQKLTGCDAGGAFARGRSSETEGVPFRGRIVVYLKLL